MAILDRAADAVASIASNPPQAAPWRPRPATLRARILLWLFAIDLTSIVAGFGGAILVRNLIWGATNWLYLLVGLIPVYLVVAVNGHAYTGENLKHPLGAARRGVRSLLFALLTVIFIGFVFKASDYFPRTVSGVGLALAGTLMAAGRYGFVRRFEAIVGGNPFSVTLIRDEGVPMPPGRYSTIVAAGDHFDPGSHDPMMYDRLARTLQSAHRVVVACRPERRAAWAHALKGAGLQGEIVVPELAELAPLEIARHDDTWTMVVATGPLGLSDRAVKRAFDLAVAGTALLLLAPLFVAIAVAIRLDSRGPVLFRQNRIGRGNEIFSILKFRSMRADRTDGTGHRSAARDDDRITRVGRFIRATSIDELPQLLNVLKGDMSIVGPRPHALGSRAADKLFWEIDRRYWHRHAAKPGLTGLAQVRGFRGATLVEADLANRLQADLEYLEDWSLWRDVKLVLLTLPVMLHRNAF